MKSLRKTSLVMSLAVLISLLFAASSYAADCLSTSIAMAVGKPYLVAGMRITRVDTDDAQVVPYEEDGEIYIPVETVAESFRGTYAVEGDNVTLTLGDDEGTLAGTVNKDDIWWAPLSSFESLSFITKAESFDYAGEKVILISNETVEVLQGFGPEAETGPLESCNYYCVEELIDRISADSSDSLDYVSFMIPAESYDLLYIQSNKDFVSPTGDTMVAIEGTEASRTYTESALFTKDDSVPTGSVMSVEVTDGEFYKYYETQTAGVYIPNEKYQDQPMNLLVTLDSAEVNETYINMVDNMVADGIIPPTVIVSLAYGNGSGAGMPLFGMTGSGRSNQYDTNDGRFASYIIEKVLPQCGLGWNGCGYDYTYELSEFSCDHAVTGGSSGGTAAFAAAWNRDDFFGNAVGYSSTILNVRQGALFQTGIRFEDKKNVRFFNQPGTGDWDWAPGTHYINGYMAAEAMQYAGYDFYFSTAYASHGTTQRQTLPSALAWMWGDTAYGEKYESAHESEEYWSNFEDGMFYNIMSNQNDYTASFDTAGGSAVAEMTGLHFADKITLPEAPTLEGKTFKGWSDGSKIFDAQSTYGICSDAAFTAVWE